MDLKVLIELAKFTKTHETMDNTELENLKQMIAEASDADYDTVVSEAFESAYRCNAESEKYRNRDAREMYLDAANGLLDLFEIEHISAESYSDALNLLKSALEHFRKSS